MIEERYISVFSFSREKAPLFLILECAADVLAAVVVATAAACLS